MSFNELWKARAGGVRIPQSSQINDSNCLVLVALSHRGMYCICAIQGIGQFLQVLALAALAPPGAGHYE